MLETLIRVILAHFLKYSVHRSFKLALNVYLSVYSHFHSFKPCLNSILILCGGYQGMAYPSWPKTECYFSRKPNKRELTSFQILECDFRPSIYIYRSPFADPHVQIYKNGVLFRHILSAWRTVFFSTQCRMRSSLAKHQKRWCRKGCQKAPITMHQSEPR